MLPHASIASVASVLPPTILSSLELEERVRHASSSILFPEGTIERLTGVRHRRVASDNQHVSDLAIEAGRKALAQVGRTITDIDLLLFAAASGDITEPATANIIAAELGASCPVFDIKNACNSFLNGMEVANALIQTGAYQRILLVNGETPSRVVRTTVNGQEGLRRAFAGYTVGDAGAAMILERSETDRGILGSIFMSRPEHWPLSTVLGGGSRFPRDPEKMYFEGETSGLKHVFVEFGPPIVHQLLSKVGWTVDDPDVIITHQVSMKSFDLIVEKIGFDKSKLVIVLPELGNMVSASIPVALDIAQQEGKLKPGAKVLLLGLAAGVSIAPMALRW